MVGRFRQSRREARVRDVLGLVPERPGVTFTIAEHCDPATWVTQALAATQRSESSLPGWIRELEGMSGQRYRTFINELVRAHPSPRYLEVGSWQGSTAASAIAGNQVVILCIDNWSQFGGPKEAFLENIERAKSTEVNFTFVERDFREVGYEDLGKFDIYLFDGPHEETDQYDGVALAQPALEREHILIVDDWNWMAVRIGTLQAIADSGARIRASLEIRTSGDNSQPKVKGRESDWHNGYFVAAIQK